MGDVGDAVVEFLVGTGIIAAVIYFKIILPNKKKQAFQEEAARLEKAFIDAKNGKNKAKALVAGRAYYSFLRGGSLSICDEQSLTNDLSTM